MGNLAEQAASLPLHLPSRSPTIPRTMGPANLSFSKVRPKSIGCEDEEPA
jgi:hypothetical protein